MCVCVYVYTCVLASVYVYVWLLNSFSTNPLMRPWGSKSAAQAFALVYREQQTNDIKWKKAKRIYLASSVLGPESPT